MQYSTNPDIHLRVCKECKSKPILYILSNPNDPKSHDEYLYSCETHGPSYKERGHFRDNLRKARFAWGYWDYAKIQDEKYVCSGPSKTVYLEFPIWPNHTPAFCKYCGEKTTGDTNQYNCKACKKWFDKPHRDYTPILMREAKVKERTAKPAPALPKFCENCGENSEITPCNNCKTK